MATTRPQRITSFGLGSSDGNLLSSIFPRGSRHDLSNYSPEDENLKLVNSIVVDNPDLPNFDPNYTNAPQITQWHIKHGTTGEAGNTNPNSLIPLPNYSPPENEMGSGKRSPHDTTAVIANQDFRTIVPGSSG